MADLTLDADAKAALAASARAFERAKKKGYVWLDQQTGMFDTYESDGIFMPKPPKNPHQLRLA